MSSITFRPTPTLKRLIAKTVKLTGQKQSEILRVAAESWLEGKTPEQVIAEIIKNRTDAAR